VALATHLLDIGGTRRRLLVAEPTGTPSTVVLSLHGSRSGPENQARLSRMAPWSDRGAVVAFPEGSLASGSGREWDLTADVSFLAMAVAHLRESYGVSTRRLCLTGMSGGARMASRYASTQPDDVVLLGPVAGLRAPAVATRARPLRVVAFHGTSDRINPYAGSGTARWGESVLDAATAWARANGVSPQPRHEEVSRTLTRIAFGADDHPGAVTLWVSRGAGHTWPGTRLPLGLRLFLGRTSYDVDATAELWRVLGTV
jgi:polyhydroxybutyrate depolymerase